MGQATATVEDVKAANRRAIFDCLRRQSMISRTRLAAETGLSKATVTRILSGMIEDGLVEEVRTATAGKGRPHVLVRLIPKARYAIGIELTTSVARVTLTDMDARLLRQRIPPMRHHDVHHVVEQLVEGVSELTREIPVSQLVGVGVSVPGVVDSTVGVVNLDFLVGWQDVPLASLLQERVGLPVSVYNRAHAAAWGERWYGIGRQASDLMYVRLGGIVEAGLVFNSRLHVGKTFTAGALGHMTVDPAGSPCTCGNHGCLNTLVTTSAVLSRARDLLQEQHSGFLLGLAEGNPAMLTLEHLIRATQSGDALAVQVFSEVGRALGIVIASILNLLNLDLVIIGGPLSAAGNVLLTPLQREVHQRALASSLILGRIELSKLGPDAASVGAASLMLRRLVSTSSG